MVTPSKTNPSAIASDVEVSVAGVTSVIKAVRKHWPIVAACALLGGGGSLLYTKAITRVYDAGALLEINQQVSQPLGESNSPTIYGLGDYDADLYYKTQYQIITSMPVLKGAAEALSLPTDYQFFGLKGPPATPIPLDVAAAALSGHVSVEPIRDSRLVRLRVTDTDANRAKRICQAVAEAYVSQNLENAVASSSEAVVWLNGQIDHLKAELESDENSLYDFKQKNDLPSTSINEASNMLRLEMQEYDMALTHTKTRREELAAREAELSKIKADNPDDIPASELLSNTYLQQLREEYRSALTGLAALHAEGKGDNHPAVKDAQGRVEQAKAGLLREIQNIQAAVAQDLAVVEREQNGQAALFDESRRRAVDLNMKEIEYHRLDRNRDENEKLYSLLLERMKQTDLTRMMRVNNIRLVEPAATSGVPIKPKVGLNVAVGFMGGFLLGFFLAWLREQLDMSLKTPVDIETKLGLAFLGLLPVLDESKGGGGRKGRRRRRQAPAPMTGPPELVVHARPNSGVAEAARSIRTNLTFMSPDRPYRKMLISSAAPSEGKTTVACSIAIALAQAGERVVIIDCDLRRPRLHRIFDRVGDAGITNILVGDATVEEVARPTVVENLYCIPAGPLPPNPADILQSERFRRLVNELGEKFDRVLIDSPPLAAVTDPTIISTLVDGTLFVARAFETGKYLAVQGLRALRDIGAPIIGCVLNAVDLDHHEYSSTGYGIRYYYYYYKADRYRANGDFGPRGGGGVEAQPPN